MSSVTSHAAQIERPERSRNAKAQARHRAKRKAYIEQLESTVTKLQMSLGFTHDDVAVLPPPLIRIRELEQENARLIKENDDFRRMLAELGRSPEGFRRNSPSTYPDASRIHDRTSEYKRKKYGGNPEAGYMSPSDTPPQMHEPYPSSSQHVISGSSSLFNLHAASTFQMPNTPSGSSATSSPPFSPAQMQEPLHSPVEHRPSPMTGTQSMSSYSSRAGHYAAVKVEEDGYVTHPESLLKASMERFLVEIADVIIPRVDGPHFTFVDPRKHDDMISMIRNARRLVSLFEEKHISKRKIVIPATFEGIRAAQVLESEHAIHTNLYLVSSLLHAAACAEAGATTITVPVGRLLDWYERRRRTDFKDLSIHPGTESIQASIQYFKLHGIKTKVIGSEFRSLSEIVPLTGLDAICISKDQADGLKGCQISVSISSATSSSPAALLRARQALYPTKLLSAHSGFMDTMSTETRTMITEILYGSLRELKCHLDELQSLMARELADQYNSRTLDLKSLYKARNERPHRMKKGTKVSSSGDLQTKNMLPGWSLEEDRARPEEASLQRISDVSRSDTSLCSP
ncbi:putative transaldolase [Termitomyces sp. T112]|nr:putative transaldolase [Termitomyces sp. T112]